MVPVAAFFLLTSMLLAACGGDDPGLTRAEVEEIVRAEVAAAQTPPRPVTALTEADVEEAVSNAVAEMPRPEPGLTRAEVEEIVKAAVTEVAKTLPGLTADEVQRVARAAVAAIPPRSAAADYTRFVVEGAIARYEMQGPEAALAYYSRAESVDGQWYVFIIDENDFVVAHPDPERLGLDVNGWVGTDANGYNFGPEMLSATEEGKWVSYVYRNPESGGLGSDDFELKNVWVMRHDGLLFASGWYITADDFTRKLVSLAVDSFRSGGLAETVEYFASPGDALAGLESAIAYYNTTETVDGAWSAFILDESGRIVAHSDPSLIGTRAEEVFGGEVLSGPEEGGWVTTESMRIWVATYDGFVFGSGWLQDKVGPS